MSVSAVDDLLSLVAKKDMFDLRAYFKDNPEGLDALFEEYVNAEQWAAEHPILSMKAIALLKPEKQHSDPIMKLLRAVVASGVFWKDHFVLAGEVVQDAIRVDNWDFIGTLLGLGMNGDIAMANTTLLHRACEKGQEAVALRLIASGVNVDAEDGNRKTALHHAACQNMANVCEALLKNNAYWLVLDNERCSPLYYAYEMGYTDVMNALKRFSESILWEKELLRVEVQKQHTEKAAVHVNDLLAGTNAWEYLSYILADYYTGLFVVNHFRDFLEKNIDRVRIIFKDYGQYRLLRFLPLLEPEMIKDTIMRISADDKRKWLQAIVDVEDGSDLRLSVRRGLHTVYENWFLNIDWNDVGQESPSNVLISDITNYVNRIPLETLAAAVEDECLRPILLSYLRILKHDQLAVIIPQLNVDDFMAMMTNSLNAHIQAGLLCFATKEQKLSFLAQTSFALDPSVAAWLDENYDLMCRLQEAYIDARYAGKGNEEAKFCKFAEALRQAHSQLSFTISLRLAVFNKMKRAFETNGLSPDLQALISRKLIPVIQGTQLASIQLEDLMQALRKDRMYKILQQKESGPPREFLCGISLDPMEDPVSAHGHAFERTAITQWLEGHNTCPFCNKLVKLDDFVADNALKGRIETWKQKR